MNLTRTLAFILVILSFVSSYYFYGMLPENIAIHWGISGKPDGFSQKSFGVYFLPLITAVIFFILMFFPRIDPMRKNAKGFEKYYDLFIFAIIGFFFYLNLSIILFNLGYLFDMNQALLPAFAALFYVIGVLLEHSKQNWFIGIRTPWTLSNEQVWEKTHNLGAKMFKAIGVVSLMLVLIPSYGIIISVGLVLLAAVSLVIYSYVEFTKVKSDKVNNDKKR